MLPCHTALKAALQLHSNSPQLGETSFQPPLVRRDLQDELLSSSHRKDKPLTQTHATCPVICYSAEINYNRKAAYFVMTKIGFLKPMLTHKKTAQPISNNKVKGHSFIGKATLMTDTFQSPN
jgi:hypothetical protein